ncbi:MAG: hypothetical protein M3Z04_07440 [Chloroflexota bacterium]|nr:hypothetical protein [Chloroflexota bacterium]
MSTQRLPPPGYPVPPPAPAPQPTQQLGPLKKYTQRRYMLFHLVFTLRLISRCLGDRRVASGSKVIFIGVTGFLLAALLAPELSVDFVAALVPIVGPLFDLVGIPFEGVVDWGLLILVIGWLMSLFPPDVLAYHISELRGQALPPAPPPTQYLPPRR